MSRTPNLFTPGWSLVLFPSPWTEQTILTVKAVLTCWVEMATNHLNNKVCLTFYGRLVLWGYVPAITHFDRAPRNARPLSACSDLTLSFCHPISLCVWPSFPRKPFPRTIWHQSLIGAPKHSQSRAYLRPQAKGTYSSDWMHVICLCEEARLEKPHKVWDFSSLSKEPFIWKDGKKYP